jgi:hypothetical protein
MRFHTFPRWSTQLAVALGVGLVSAGPSASAQAFTQGNLVVYRVGDGTSVSSGAATTVFLDEYTPAGVFIQSVALPTTGSGVQKRLTASNSATSEGLLSLSSNGRFLVLTGYDAAVGASGVSGSSTSGGSPIVRVVGRVDVNKTIDTSTTLTEFSGNNVRSATSIDGSGFWVTGGNSGLRYQALGATAASTQVLSTTTNLRQVNIFAGQLYVTTGSGTAFRIGTIGTGAPTTSGQVATTLSNIPAATNVGSPYAFYFADLDPTVSGPISGLDTLYLTDDGGASGGPTARITKYCFVPASGNWEARGTVGASGEAYRGLTGRTIGSTATLYSTRLSGSSGTPGGELVSIADTSGYNQTINGTITSLVTAGTNRVFRGVALTPETRTISYLSQTSAFAGATAITLTVSGERFSNSSGAQSRVYFGETQLSTTFVNDAQLTATIPTTSLTTPGTYTVTVRTPTGTYASNAINFTVNAPTITSLNPAEITAGSGDTSLVVTGTNFVSGSKVFWYDTELTTTFNSATQLTATIPASYLTKPGYGKIAVKNSANAVTEPRAVTIKEASPPTAASINVVVLNVARSGNTVTVTYAINQIGGSGPTTVAIPAAPSSAVTLQQGMTSTQAATVSLFSNTIGANSSVTGTATFTFASQPSGYFFFRLRGTYHSGSSSFGTTQRINVQ